MRKLLGLFAGMSKPLLYIHIDADAFFASVEQCLHKELKGKPVVTGREGSIVIAMSYEAKALGVERGIPTHILRKEYPQVYMVASDYQMYKIFSDRMIAIIANHLPTIERTSVDECKGYFPADIHCFEEAQKMASTIKEELEMKLGCTFSLGVARTPLLAKIASAMNKPSGITMIDTREQYQQLCSLPIEKVPGFGRRMTPRLRSLGIGTIQQFINRYPIIKDNFSVTSQRIYQQLIEIVVPDIKKKPLQSMNRARSFQATGNYEELLGQLSLNTEYLLRKLRYQKLQAQSIYVTLRDKERNSYTKHIRLLHATNSHEVLHSQCIALLKTIYLSNVNYRYVSVTFGGLVTDVVVQLDLFGETQKEASRLHMWNLIDQVNGKLGTSSVTTATSLFQPKSLGSHLKNKEISSYMVSRYDLLPRETQWRRLQYPYLGKVS